MLCLVSLTQREERPLSRVVQIFGAKHFSFAGFLKKGLFRRIDVMVGGDKRTVGLFLRPRVLYIYECVCIHPKEKGKERKKIRNSSLSLSTISQTSSLFASLIGIFVAKEGRRTERNKR